MKYLKISALSVALLTAAFAACDNDDPIPAGNISGKVSPAEAKAVVWAIMDKDTIAKATPDEQGDFAFKSLTPSAQWKIGYEATAGEYEDHVVGNVKVEDGKTTTLEAVVLEEPAPEEPEE